MSETETVVKDGSPWTNVRYFSTFEEASILKDTMKSSDLSGTLQVKIKRCGVAGALYVVKARQTVEMKAAVESVEQTLESKPSKKERKTKTRG